MSREPQKQDPYRCKRARDEHGDEFPSPGGQSRVRAAGGSEFQRGSIVDRNKQQEPARHEKNPPGQSDGESQCAVQNHHSPHSIRLGHFDVRDDELGNKASLLFEAEPQLFAKGSKD